MHTPTHNHPPTEGYNLTCPRCKLNAAAPALLEAARQIVWKLSHNFDLPSKELVPRYQGPAYLTREDITIKMLQAALDQAQG